MIGFLTENPTWTRLQTFLCFISSAAFICTGKYNIPYLQKPSPGAPAEEWFDHIVKAFLVVYVCVLSLCRSVSNTVYSYQQVKNVLIPSVKNLLKHLEQLDEEIRLMEEEKERAASLRARHHEQQHREDMEIAAIAVEHYNQLKDMLDVMDRQDRNQHADLTFDASLDADSNTDSDGNTDTSSACGSASRRKSKGKGKSKGKSKSKAKGKPKRKVSLQGSNQQFQRRPFEANLADLWDDFDWTRARSDIAARIYERACVAERQINRGNVQFTIG